MTFQESLPSFDYLWPEASRKHENFFPLLLKYKKKKRTNQLVLPKEYNLHNLVKIQIYLFKIIFLPLNVHDGALNFKNMPEDFPIILWSLFATSWEVMATFVFHLTLNLFLLNLLLKHGFNLFKVSQGIEKEVWRYIFSIFFNLQQSLPLRSF